MNIYTRKIPTMGITIVPMLDILTILLIFFIVHTEFKRQVSVLNLDLPQTHNISGEKGSNDSILLEVGADGTLALRRTNYHRANNSLLWYRSNWKKPPTAPSRSPQQTPPHSGASCKSSTSSPPPASI